MGSCTSYQHQIKSENESTLEELYFQVWSQVIQDQLYWSKYFNRSTHIVNIAVEVEWKEKEEKRRRNYAWVEYRSGEEKEPRDRYEVGEQVDRQFSGKGEKQIGTRIKIHDLGLWLPCCNRNKYALINLYTISQWSMYSSREYLYPIMYESMFSVYQDQLPEHQWNSNENQVKYRSKICQFDFPGIASDHPIQPSSLTSATLKRWSELYYDRIRTIMVDKTGLSSDALGCVLSFIFPCRTC